MSVSVNVSVSVTADLYTCILEKKCNKFSFSWIGLQGHLFTHCLHVGILYGAFFTI